VAIICGAETRRHLGTNELYWRKNRNDPIWRPLVDLPDYENDLNLVHEAEERLSLCDDPECNDDCGAGTWGKYTRCLDEIVDIHFHRGEKCLCSYSATALQRCLAFCKTFN
jgi:hypothetical protein